MFRDSPRAYGRLTRLLHWVVAVLIVTQLSSVYANSVWKDNAFSQAIFPWHTTIGVGVVGLMVMRTLWALSQRRRRPVHEGSLQRAAVVGHVFLYALLILMPLSGALMTWGMGYGIYVFGISWFEGADVPWAASLGKFHGTIAWLLSFMIVGHVGMAMYHHFGRRDDTLRRMVGSPDDTSTS